MTIETKRLILRPWEESDAEDLYFYAKDPDIGPAAGWPAHKNVEESLMSIRNVLSAPETYAIVLRETGQPIGSVGLKFHSDLSHRDDEPELGYWIGKPYWGRGLMPEAAGALLRHAFLDCGYSKVWCGYYEGNEKSKRVQQKLGFVYQWATDDLPVPLLNEVRRGYVNLLIREDWEKGQTK